MFFDIYFAGVITMAFLSAIVLFKLYTLKKLNDVSYKTILIVFGTLIATSYAGALFILLFMHCPTVERWCHKIVDENGYADDE